MMSSSMSLVGKNLLDFFKQLASSSSSSLYIVIDIIIYHHHHYYIIISMISISAFLLSRSVQTQQQGQTKFTTTKNSNDLEYLRTGVPSGWIRNFSKFQDISDLKKSFEICEKRKCLIPPFNWRPVDELGVPKEVPLKPTKKINQLINQSVNKTINQ